MNVSELTALGGLVIGLAVAGISAWSVIRAAHKQADAALDAARYQTKVNQELSIFQIQATLSFNSKQHWIDTLRAELADLYSELLMLQAYVQKKGHADQVSTGEGVKRASHITARIALLLDADQPLHNELLGALQSPWHHLDRSDQSTFSSAVNTIMKSGQLVLKHELEQLQRLSEFTPRGELEPSEGIGRKRVAR